MSQPLMLDYDGGSSSCASQKEVKSVEYDEVKDSTEEPDKKGSCDIDHTDDTEPRTGAYNFIQE